MNASKLPVTLVIMSALVGATGCRVVGDIFKAGVWVGVVAIVAIVGLVFGISRLFASR